MRRISSKHRVPSGHHNRGVQESVGDDSHGNELLGTRRTNSHQVIRQKACLASFHIPKQDVAEGFVVSKDSLLKIDGVPLGLDFWKVMVDKAIKPNALLERTRQGVTKVGDAVGVYVAWRSSDVFLKD
ncbi:hypothetical protein Vadar_022249 [Vaccinium darrowii]|uniref:Uncharacterized protein n=1 Tax=Vaccinium darrowii TaxID=229202 RepID=A0ACB7YNK8_9ERIC|nr:hypothetical protein Vadar_022249 [Vaccinium darrowii]